MRRCIAGLPFSTPVDGQLPCGARKFPAQVLPLRGVMAGEVRFVKRETWTEILLGCKSDGLLAHRCSAWGARLWVSAARGSMPLKMQAWGDDWLWLSRIAAPYLISW